MKKIIRLTETDLTNLVKKIINENQEDLGSKVRKLVLNILRNLGYDKRERFLSIELEDRIGLYVIYLNGEFLARTLSYKLENPTPESIEEIENSIRKSIKSNPEKFGL